MPTRILHPTHLAPSALDNYLAAGYRPSGQSIYISEFIQIVQGELISVIPTRLPLAGHHFRKSARKLLRRNDAKYRAVIQPAVDPTPDQHRVYQAYSQQEPEKGSIALDYHLRQGNGKRVLNTHESRIYLGPELVAFSYFDVGQETAYSKMGVYHPDQHKDSLGIYSMLLEVRYCMLQGFAYYYPGYVSRQHPAFDYKHRIGALEFFDFRTQSWLPFTDFEPERHDPLLFHENKSRRLQQELARVNIPTLLVGYPYSDARFAFPKNEALLDAPMYLQLYQSDASTLLVAVYLSELEQYVLAFADIVAPGLLERLIYYRDRPNSHDILEVKSENIVLATDSAAELAGYVTRYFSDWTPPPSS